MHISHRRIPLLAALLLVAAVSACGFHLRGELKLPALMARTYIVAGEAGALGQLLAQQLREAGAEVVAERVSATAVITLLAERQSRHILSVGTSGQVSEYELIYEVEFEVRDGDGKTVLPARGLSRSRELRLDPSNVLGKSREEEQIYLALREQMATAILQNVQYTLSGSTP